MNCHVKIALPASDALDPRALARDLARYRTPSVGRSLFELVVTIVPMFVLAGASWAGLAAGYPAALLLAVLAGGFVLRLFIIQHDCGHGAYFRSRRANDWLGRALGVLTVTPYDVWRAAHAEHHASSGNLDRRGIGDVDTLTVAEYRALPFWGRFGYRAYRHPLTIFGIGPAWLFLLRNRLPIGQMRDGWRPWVSAMGTNAALAGAVAALAVATGGWSFLLVWVTMLLVGASAGVWLFYVQHQFEATFWARKPGWSFHDGALRGASYYALPAPLRWITGNIGIHHVHHLVSRIPFYRLTQVLRDRPALAAVNRLTVRESLACVRLALWDEQAERLVPFPR